MINYLAIKTPVILFHRTTFLWKGLWHYSVITGYNRRSETFSLHAGSDAYRDMDISEVVGAWIEGGRWSYVMLPPESLPDIVPFPEAIENALAFLRLGKHEAAYQLSQSILKRWPERYEADVIMAQVLLKRQRVLGRWLWVV